MFSIILIELFVVFAFMSSSITISLHIMFVVGSWLTRQISIIGTWCGMMRRKEIPATDMNKADIIELDKFYQASWWTEPVSPQKPIPGLKIWCWA